MVYLILFILGDYTMDNKELREYFTKVRNIENDIYIIESFISNCKFRIQDFDRGWGRDYLLRIERATKEMELLDEKTYKKRNLLGKLFIVAFITIVATYILTKIATELFSDIGVGYSEKKAIPWIAVITLGIVWTLVVQFLLIMENIKR
jgi:hypothetical protein